MENIIPASGRIELASNVEGASSQQGDTFDMTKSSAALTETREAEAALGEAEHVHGYRCFLLVTSRVGDKETSSPIGTMRDRESLFPRVKLYVNYREAKILDPNDKRHGETHQVWPTSLRIVVDFMKGTLDTTSGKLQTEANQSICFHLPAYDHEDRVESKINISGPKQYKNTADITMPDSSKQSITSALIRHSKTQEEVDFIKSAVEKQQFCEVVIEASCRNLQPANSFVGLSGLEEFQDFVDLVERLELSNDQADSLTFRLLFLVGREHREKIAKSVTNFRNAKDIEGTKHWLGKILGLSSGAVWLSERRALKPGQLLPRFHYRPFLIEPSIKLMLLARAMDLTLHYHYEKLGYKMLEEEFLPARLLHITDIKVPTYMCFIKTINKALARAPLVIGTEAMLSFPKHKDWGTWFIRIGRNPLVASNDDAFGVLTVGKNTPIFSCQSIGEATLTSKGSLKELLGSMEYEHIQVKVRVSDVTERQQWKALKLINKLSTGDAVASAKDIPDIVCPILAGYGVKNIGSKSYYSDGFVAKQIARIEEIHLIFASAINKLGARISEEQLKLVFWYLSNAPADLLALVNGPAGTRKTSTVGLIISFLCLDDPEEKGKMFLVVAKMHKTINNTIRTIAPIVKLFTGREVVREFSDTFDMAVMMWMVNGQPKDMDPEWTKQLEAEELQELRDLVASISQTNQAIPGTSPKAPETAIYLTTIYRAMCDMDMNKTNWGQPLYHSQADAKPGTKRPSENQDDDAEGGPSKMRKGDSAERNPVAEASETLENWQAKLKQLQQMIIAKLQYGASKVEDKKMMSLLHDIKVLWKREKACVTCTTISRSDSKEVMDLPISGVVLDEAQYPDVHDTDILMAHYAKTLKIFIGDVLQPSPFVKDGRINPFSCVRRQSAFELEVMRGRHYFELTQSGRTGPSGVDLVSTLIYGGRLHSAVADDPMMWDLTKWFAIKFGATSHKIIPHLLINMPYGKGEQVGPTSSTLNLPMVYRTVRLVRLLEMSIHGLLPSHIAIIDPYGVENTEFERIFSDLYPDPGWRPKVGTILGMMGDEIKVAVLHLPKTSGLGIIDNNKGWWCVGLSRSHVATIIVANDTELQLSQSKWRNREDASKKDGLDGFTFWSERVRPYFRDRGAYIEWPNHIPGLNRRDNTFWLSY